MEKRSLNAVVIITLFFLLFQPDARASDFCFKQAENAVIVKHAAENDISPEFVKDSFYDFVNSNSMTSTEYVYVLTLLEKFPDGLSENGDTYEVHLKQETCEVVALFKRN